MKKIILALAALAAAVSIPALTSCDNDDKSTWEEYADWRIINEDWVNDQAGRKDASGNPLFSRFVPKYNSGVYILQRTIGESHTENLQPLYTSYVTVNYEVHFYNDTLLDRGTGFYSNLSSPSLIDGWSMAIMNMHAGDSAEVIMPYKVAYGPSGASNIPPYSALRFNIRLVDIDNYETKP